LEATAEAVKEEEKEGWRYYQSQHGKLPQSRSYELPYSIQEPLVLTPQYQATTSQEVARAPRPRARAPRARAPQAHAPLITRLPLASRSPLRARLISKYEDKPIPLPPRLRFKSEINNIERRSGGVFITYNYNIVIQYLKDSPFTKTLISISL
jgi:hypothetical protein